MGSTQAQLRAAVRQELRDEDATAYIWTDAVLNRHLQDAIAHLQRVAPKITRTTTAVPASPQRIDLSALMPSSFLWVEAIEYLTDKYPQQFIPFREEVGPKVYLLTASLPVVGDTIGIWYAGTYSVAEGASDAPGELDGPIILGATLFACRDQSIDLIPKLGPRDGPRYYRQLVQLLTPRWEAELTNLRHRFSSPLWQPSWTTNRDESSL